MMVRCYCWLQLRNAILAELDEAENIAELENDAY